MSGLVGILLSVKGFTSVVDKNGIDSMHPVLKKQNASIKKENLNFGCKVKFLYLVL